MDRDNSQIFHTVVITGLKDPSKNEKVAQALSRVIKNMPQEKILKRLESLPWTLTRKATPKNATRLARYLDKVGARIKVAPPLPASVMTDALETQILPDTHLLSQTQVMSATQIMSVSQEMPAQGTPPPPPRSTPPTPPPPIAPGRKIEPPMAAPIPRQTPPPPPVPPDEGGLDIEPLSLGGVLDKTFQICRGHFWKLLAVIGVAWGVAAGIGLVAAIVVLGAGLTFGSMGKVPLWILIPMGVVLFPVAVALFFALIYLPRAAIIHAVSSIYLGREVQVRESYSFALGRLRKLILTYILVSLLMIGVTIATAMAGAAVYFLFSALFSKGWAVVCSLPFWLALFCVLVYVAIRLLLIDKIIVIENLGYTEAIKRAWNLLAGKTGAGWPKSYWWRLALLWALFLVIQQTVAALFQIPGQILILTHLLPNIVSQILNQILSITGGVLAGMFGSVCMVIFYYDLRNRKEGFDLGMLAGMQRE